MSKQEKLLDEARSLISGLERISADSVWAHRSSGYRGAMLRILDRLERDTSSVVQEKDLDRLEQLMRISYRMLVNAAREIRK